MHFFFAARGRLGRLLSQKGAINPPLFNFFGIGKILVMYGNMAVGLKLANPPNDGALAGFVKLCEMPVLGPAIARLLG